MLNLSVNTTIEFKWERPLNISQQYLYTMILVINDILYTSDQVYSPHVSNFKYSGYKYRI